MILHFISCMKEALINSDVEVKCELCRREGQGVKHSASSGVLDRIDCHQACQNRMESMEQEMISNQSKRVILVSPCAAGNRGHKRFPV